MNIKQMREQQAKLVAEARTYYDEVATADESRAKELEASYDKAMAEHDRLEKLIQKEERLAAAEAALDEPETRTPDRNPTPVTVETTDEARKAAFKAWLQRGVSGLSAEQRQIAERAMANIPEEVRAQSTTTTSGGYTIPEGFLPEITKAMKAWGPMLDPGITRVLVTATGNPLPWPTMDDTAQKGAILGENVQIGEQDITFGQKQLDAYMYTSKLIRVSYQLLQDSAFNVESEIIRPAFGERLGRIGNEHLTTGTGVGQPNGIVTASSAGITAAVGGAVSFDDIIDLEHSVDPAYRRSPGVRFMFNDSTLKYLRKLKDGDGNYLWQPADARTGAPASVLAYPYSVNQDMASIGGSTKPIIFGDFNKYIVRIVRDMTMLRLTERYADYLQVGFFAFMRMDGELSDTAAIKHMVMQSA